MENEGIPRDVANDVAENPEGALAHFPNLVFKTTELLKGPEAYDDCAISGEDIARLPDGEREDFIRFYGRFTASLGIGGMNLNAEKWKEDIIFESRELYAHPITRPLLEHVYARAVFFMAAERNSNTYTGSPGWQTAHTHRLYEDLHSRGLEHAAGLLENPFDLETGDELLSFSPERKEFSTHHINEVDIRGADSMIQIDEELFDLDKFNKFLAAGQYMLRDGSNYFGKLEFPKDLEVLKEGEEVVIYVLLPMQGEMPYTVQFRGTNKAELEQQYGRAYLTPRALSELLRVRFALQGQTEEKEMLYSEIRRFKAA